MRCDCTYIEERGEGEGDVLGRLGSRHASVGGGVGPQLGHGRERALASMQTGADMRRLQGKARRTLMRSFFEGVTALVYVVMSVLSA